MKLLPVVLLVVLAIYSWIEIAQSDPAQVRELPRSMWALVVFVPLVGPACWLVLGRPNGKDPHQPEPPPRRARAVAPDDDPDFLRSLRRPPKPPSDDHT